MVRPLSFSLATGTGPCEDRDPVERRLARQRPLLPHAVTRLADGGWRMADLTSVAHSDGMAAADASVAQSGELDLATVAVCRTTAAPRVSTPSRTCGSSWAGARTGSSRRWTPSATTSSCSCAGCRTSAGSSHPPCPDDCRPSRASTGPGVIDGVLEHSPADYVRRPTVPPESPTLGLTHLQFEAMSPPRDAREVAVSGLRRSAVEPSVLVDERLDGSLRARRDRCARWCSGPLGRCS